MGAVFGAQYGSGAVFGSQYDVGGATISATPGSAAANGVDAALVSATTISCGVGDVAAAGVTASVTGTNSGTSITCAVGNATASGVSAASVGARVAGARPTRSHRAWRIQTAIRPVR